MHSVAAATVLEEVQPPDDEKLRLSFDGTAGLTRLKESLIDVEPGSAEQDSEEGAVVFVA